MKKKIILLMIFFFAFQLQGGDIVMAEYNIQMGQRNSSNTEWDNHYPITKAENVKMDNGSNVKDALNLKSDTAYVDEKLASIAGDSPKGIYNTLSDLKAAYPNGTTGKYIVGTTTEEKHWYIWANNQWTDGGIYQGMGIGDGTVNLGNINKDVYTGFNGYKVVAKTTTDQSFHQILVHLVYDLSNIPSANGAMSIAYDAYSDDSNVKGFGSKIFLNNSSTDLNNAVSLTSTYEDGYTSGNMEYYLKSRENYTSGYKYAHVFIYVDISDVLKQTTFYFRNPIFAIGGQAGNLIAKGFWECTNDSSINPIVYLDKQLATVGNVNNINLENISNYLKITNKTYDVLGDSITAGWLTTKTYWQYISERTGMAINNYGVSGTNLATDNSYGQSMANRYLNMGDADYITVFGGTNDFINNVPLGTNTDTTTSTFYGALNVLLEGLIKKYPDKKIGFITPLQFSRSANENGSYLIDYVNAIKDRCGYYSIPVLDLYHNAGMTPLNDSQKTLLFGGDWLHPNALGHSNLADKIQSFLMSL